VVFTSTRSGDVELWTSDITGGDIKQVTDTVGYDGGGFFSHDGKQIVFRTTAFTEGKEDEEHAIYKDLLSKDKVKPSRMELMLIDRDGKNRRQLTNLGKAAFAPFFFPDDQRIIFSSNHADTERGRDFDLWAIGVDGKELERITNYSGFDSFPIFDPTGRYLVFASNRGGTQEGETNLFIAEWR
jgi:TolB protein